MLISTAGLLARPDQTSISMPAALFPEFPRFTRVYSLRTRSLSAMPTLLALRTAFGRLAASVALLSVAACGRLDRECRAVSGTANAFIAESERQRPRPDATPA